jgi:hypothetical protein
MNPAAWTEAAWLEERQMEVAARLAKLEPCNDFRMHLVDGAMDEWGTKQDRDERFRAAHDLLTLGYYSRSDHAADVNDAKRYETFAPIAGLVRQLVILLDDAEYNEYCSDAHGISILDARKVTKQAKDLSKAVAAWQRSL